MPPNQPRLGRTQLSDPQQAASWDAYCGRHREATPYHLSGWGNAVVDALEHEPHYLHVEDAGAIAGVFPLFLRRSRLFGTNLVSVPAANVGGPLADDDATLALLTEGAIALARERNVDFLEVRDVPADSPIASALALDRERYVTVDIDLAGGEKAVWEGLSKGTRRRVRRARGAGLVVSLHDDLDAFYPVYAATVKRLGSPPFSKRWFSALVAAFGPSLQFAVARAGSQVAAVDQLVSFRGVRYSVFAGSRADLWHVYPNQLLLWEELRDACSGGLARFDLGRSLASGSSLAFKLAWGGQVRPLTYGYHLHRARRIPVRTPDAPLYRAAGLIWSHLPDTLVTSIGPRLVKHLF